jgi:hypothetical protein
VGNCPSAYKGSSVFSKRIPCSPALYRTCHAVSNA